MAVYFTTGVVFLQPSFDVLEPIHILFKVF
jgi:hypothetical protein